MEIQQFANERRGCQKLLSCEKFCCDDFFWGCTVEQQNILWCVESETVLSELLEIHTCLINIDVNQTMRSLHFVKIDIR